MYLTAQRVLSPHSGRGGINSFLYLHGEHFELPSSGRPASPGELTAQSVSVEPPGNRVQSYLDIWGPDDVTWSEVRVGLMDFVGSCQPSPFPWQKASGRCFFRLEMELALAQNWQKELASLFRSAQALRLGAT